MFTTGEVILAQSFDRAVRGTVANAQQLVDRKNNDLREAYAEITMLRAALVNSQEQLRAERAARTVAELELDDLRRLVDEAL